MAVGAAWMTLFTMANRLQGLISTIILARLLVPEDFGIIAMAMSMIAGVELLTAVGLEIVLIQHPDPKDYHFRSAFTANVFLGILAGAAVALLAEPISAFFNEPRLVPVMWVLAASAVIHGFENIYTTWFQKDLEFQRDFLHRFVPRLLSFFVTVPLAFYLRSYWALVAGMLFASVASVLYGYYLRPAMPRFGLKGLKDLLGFSKWLFVSNLLAYGIVRGTDIIIGRTLGSFGLGSFTLANDIATMPTTQLTAPINRAVFPGYSKMAHDLALLRNGFLDVSGIIAAVVLPAAIGIAAVSDIIVPVVLGDKWLHVIPLIKLLAFYGAIVCLLTNVGPLFNAMARPYWMTYLQILGLSILLPSAWYLSMNIGLIGAAWAYLIANCVTSPVTLIIVMRLLKMPLTALLGIVWRPILAVTVMYQVVRLLIDNSGAGDVATLLGAVGVGAVAYIATLLGSWRLAGRPVGAESAIIKQVRSSIGSRLNFGGSSGS
jgi:O-antigen/teichoic acid export membrane protein